MFFCAAMGAKIRIAGDWGILVFFALKTDTGSKIQDKAAL